MNLFEKNMESFEKRYPLVAEKIKEIDINLSLIHISEPTRH